MQQKLTAQDICKLIEVLVDTSNSIGRSEPLICSNGEFREDVYVYSIGGFDIQYVICSIQQVVEVRYNGITHFIDGEDGRPVIQLLESLYQKQEDIRQNKSIEEILNIIHNDKEAK